MRNSIQSSTFIIICFLLLVMGVCATDPVANFFQLNVFDPINMNGTNGVTNMANPVNAQDAATKYYVDHAGIVGTTFTQTSNGLTPSWTTNTNSYLGTTGWTVNGQYWTNITAASMPYSGLTGLPSWLTMLSTNNGTNLTNIPAANIVGLPTYVSSVTATAPLTGGTITTTGNIGLPANLLMLNTNNGTNLTNLTAANLTGTIPTNNLPGDLPLQSVDNFVNGTNIPIAALQTNGMTNGTAFCVSNNGTNTVLVPSPSGSSGSSTPTNLSICNTRLTLTPGNPAPSTNQYAATSIYMTPYGGNQITLYNGSAWQTYTFSEVTNTVPSTASTVYDVWAYLNGSMVTNVLTAWSSTAARVANNLPTLSSGVYVGATNTNWRYIGTFATTTASGETEDDSTNRSVYNYYNRVDRWAKDLRTNTATFSSATWTNMVFTTPIQVAFVEGMPEDEVSGTVQASFIGNNSTASAIWVAWSLNSTNTPDTADGAIFSTKSSTTITGVTLTPLSAYPPIGFDYYQMIVQTGAYQMIWNNNTNTYMGIQLKLRN